MENTNTKKKENKYDLNFKQIAAIFILVLAIFVSLIGRNTLSYKSREGVVDNAISLDHISAALYNVNAFGEKMQTVYSIVPSGTYSNIVYAKNTCLKSEWIRMKVEMICVDEDFHQLNTDCFKPDFDKDYWTVGIDGYWYYNKQLDPGEKTNYLYSKIHIDKSVGNEYKTADLYINLYLEAVQSDNNGKTPFDAQGWGLVSSLINKEP